MYALCNNKIIFGTWFSFFKYCLSLLHLLTLNKFYTYIMNNCSIFKLQKKSTFSFQCKHRETVFLRSSSSSLTRKICRRLLTHSNVYLYTYTKRVAWHKYLTCCWNGLTTKRTGFQGNHHECSAGNADSWGNSRSICVIFKGTYIFFIDIFRYFLGWPVLLR